tara:strand:+ start:236 stop:1408 length:1173 start_codon:yes stop_codon:yes gene_type:complete
MNNNINAQDFKELIERYLDGKTTLEEVKLLVNYYESFQQENKWVEELGPEDIIKNRMLINILEALQQDESKEVNKIPLYKRKTFQYSVAASIALFFVFNFIYNKSNNAISEPISEPVTVNNNIPIGTHKATLTLEDGTNIALEKGRQYISDNVESNGKDLIYKSPSKPRPEIAFNYLTVPRGGQYHVKLSDGTEVWLNSESKLKYPTIFLDGETREVDLIYGEAYFDVSPSTDHNGSKFKVLSGVQEVEVLGTGFNIKAYKDETYIYTTLVEGKITVDNSSSAQILKPNQQAVLNKENKDIIISKIDVYSEIAWKKGLFSFKDKPLKDIMKVLSRWYDVDVVFEDKAIEDVHFKGVLSKNQNIEEILTLIKNTKYIHAYDIENNTILLRN